MKKVVNGEELREKMLEAIHLLCDTVKMTVGPKGSNAIIDHSLFSPFITNDGVTIAQNIESEDSVTNTILTLAKEAAIKTNEIVGDGTTTTLILLESIYEEGFKKIKEGIPPIVVKQSLNDALKQAIAILEEISHSPSNEELQNIARISANDDQIGKLIADLFLKNSHILIQEHEKEETIYEFIGGYFLETNLASPYYLNKSKKITLKNSYLLLFDDDMLSLEPIIPILNEIIKEKKALMIIANDFELQLINDIIGLMIENNLDIILFKNNLYGERKLEILEDLKMISNAEIVNSFSLSFASLGTVKEIKIDEEKAVFEFSKNIQNYITNLQNVLIDTKDSYKKEFLQERIAKLNKSYAIIYVGEKTPTERKEKKMRFDDALGAITSAKNGVVVGGGLSYLIVSNRLNTNDLGSSILKLALTKPFLQILENVGISHLEVLNTIRKESYQKVFNACTYEYEEIQNTQVLDPLFVTIYALKNAVSIAGMLLTTTSLVINEQNTNTIKEYSLEM